jgi:hypothetical protein
MNPDLNQIDPAGADMDVTIVLPPARRRHPESAIWVDAERYTTSTSRCRGLTMHWDTARRSAGTTTAAGASPRAPAHAAC